MEKKVLHIITHTHWDREWYMPFEKHRARLVELIDSLLDILDNNPNFRYFHFDGQVIPIEDYLEIRPQMEERLKAYIKEGRIQIGPWYVLQDEYLISGESNVRNMLIGLRECEKYGGALRLGYFPDSFGNISQAPQILRGFDIDNAVFGRGINPVLYDNTIVEGQKNCSEVIWRSPDGSEVLGILFAHWYHNAMEIPADTDQAVKKIRSIIESTAAVATTPHLLGMNGCDHQPVQADIGDILKKVQEYFPDCELRHSNFKDYIEIMRQYRDGFAPVVGELNSQSTDGYGALIGTASARVYLKQANHRAQLTLEKHAEPLSVIGYLHGKEYKSDIIRKSWKQMLQNHAHDSICGCSIDPVHRECMSRFEKSTALAESVVEDVLDYITDNIRTDFAGEQDKVIVVYNPNSFVYNQLITAYADLPKGCETPVEEFGLFDLEGNPVLCDIVDLGETFTYILPKNRFRKVTYYRRLAVTFTAENLPSLGYTCYLLKQKRAAVTSGLMVGERYAENAYIRLDIHPDGSLKLTNKIEGTAVDGLNIFVDGGDCGNEYNYQAPATDRVYTTEGSIAQIECIGKNNTAAKFKITHVMQLPQSCDTQQRSSETAALTITSYVTLGEKARLVDIYTEMDNTVKDHRLRAIFKNDILTDKVYADGQFDLVERPIKPGDNWINPDNSQRQQAFVMLRDSSKSLIIANRGLCEYEVLRDGHNTVAITLLRCVGFLGDWGVFPTPEAQCQGKQVAHYSVMVCGEKTADYQKLAYGFATGLPLTAQANKHDGKLEPVYSFAQVDSEYGIISALKKAEDDDSVILRIYNPTTQDDTVAMTLDKAVKRAAFANLNEEEKDLLLLADNQVRFALPAKKIITLKLFCHDEQR